MDNWEQFLNRTNVQRVSESGKNPETPEPLSNLGAEAGSTFVAPEAVDELTAEVRQLRAEKQNLFDRLLRQQAELDNLRKRTERDKAEFREFANADLIRALLPTLDGFERALKHCETGAPDEFSRGMRFVYDGLLDVLKREGLTPIEALGQTFDPNVHHAVECVEDEQHRDQEIVEELVRGYKFKHRLLRPSMVKVAVSPPM